MKTRDSLSFRRLLGWSAVVLHRGRPGSSSDEAKSTVPTETPTSRAVKQFDPERLLDGFQQATERLLSVIQSESSFRRPVTVAIDITTIRCFGNVRAYRWLAGRRTAKVENIQVRHALDCRVEHPAYLAVEPVRESSSWDENPPNRVHRVVRRLVRRAQEHVPVRWCCATEFDSKAVYQTLSNLNVNYLIPKRIHSAERENIETMDEDGQEVAVESASIHVDHGSHAMQFLYVPSTKEKGQRSLRRTSQSAPRKLRRSAAGTVVAGRLRTSTRASRTISWRRPPRKITECGYSTSCSRCYCTISGGSLISC